MRMSEEKKQQERRKTAELLGLISQFGISMLVPMCFCFFVGRALDKHFDTVWWTIGLFFVGALAGFRNIYLLAKRYFKNDTESLSGSLNDGKREEGSYGQDRKSPQREEQSSGQDMKNPQREEGKNAQGTAGACGQRRDRL